MFNLCMDQTDWQRIRLENYYVTISVKLRDFQYRLAII